MAAKKIQTRTRTRTRTIVATALFAGAGLAAAAGVAATSFTRTPVLNVSLTPGQERLTHVVSGAEDLNTVSLDFQARGGEAIIDQLVFSITGDTEADFTNGINTGSASAADRFASCTLESPDGTVVAGPSPAVSGYLTFSDDFTIAADATSTYIVQCDLSSVAVTDGDPDQFMVWIGGESAVRATINGVALAGSSLVIGRTSYDTLNSLGEVSLVVRGQGALSVNLAPDSPYGDILLAGSTRNEVGRWAFEATAEDVYMTELSFDDVGGSTASSTATLECVDEDGGAQIDTQSVTDDGHVRFETECYVRAGEASTIVLSVDVNPIGAGASSGDKIRFVLNAMESGTFEAVGVTSGTDISEEELAVIISAREMTVRQSKPTLSLSSASPSGTAIPGVLEALRFNVAADASGDIAVKQLMFKVVTTDNANTGWNDCGDGAGSNRFGDHSRWNVYNLSVDTSTPISDEGDWSLLKADGSACGQAAEPVAYVVLNLSADAASGFLLDINAGMTQSISLKVDTRGASESSDDTLQLTLIDHAEARVTRHDAILWNDGTVATNIAGQLIDALPVIGNTLSF